MIWPVLMMVMIFILSSLTGTPGPNGGWLVASLDPALQNVLHVPLYATLQVLWLRSLTKAERTVFSTVTLSLALTCSYGILDELHQGFVPGRYASVLDGLLNLLGGVFGTVVWYGVTSMKRKKILGALN